MGIRPSVNDWKKIEVELFFDDGMIVLEMHDLEFSGTAIIEDPESKSKERIEFKAPINTA
jgi:hypothetical protein